MHPAEQKLLASLAEETEPWWWGGLFNSVCPWPATDLFDALAELCETGLVEASHVGSLECYVITDAGREALAGEKPGARDDRH